MDTLTLMYTLFDVKVDVLKCKGLASGHSLTSLRGFLGVLFPTPFLHCAQSELLFRLRPLEATVFDLKHHLIVVCGGGFGGISIIRIANTQVQMDFIFIDGVCSLRLFSV